MIIPWYLYVALGAAVAVLAGVSVRLFSRLIRRRKPRLVYAISKRASFHGPDGAESIQRLTVLNKGNASCRNVMVKVTDMPRGGEHECAVTTEKSDHATHLTDEGPMVAKPRLRGGEKIELTFKLSGAQFDLEQATVEVKDDRSQGKPDSEEPDRPFPRVTFWTVLGLLLALAGLAACVFFIYDTVYGSPRLLGLARPLLDRLGSPARTSMVVWWSDSTLARRDTATLNLELVNGELTPLTQTVAKIVVAGMRPLDQDALVDRYYLTVGTVPPKGRARYTLRYVRAKPARDSVFAVVSQAYGYVLGKRHHAEANVTFLTYSRR
jgi:hypothetical protein